MTTKKVKHVCDRCGNSVEFEFTDTPRYDKGWQAVKLGQTGAELDLCAFCNIDLLEFMQAKGAENMGEALFRTRTIV